jgi:hypothetical protein
VFGACKPKISDKAEAYLAKVNFGVQKNSSHTHKYWTWLKVFSGNKHASFLLKCAGDQKVL